MLMLLAVVVGWLGWVDWLVDVAKTCLPVWLRVDLVAVVADADCSCCYLRVGVIMFVFVSGGVCEMLECAIDLFECWVVAGEEFEHSR